MIHPASVSGDSVAQEIIPSRSYHSNNKCLKIPNRFRFTSLVCFRRDYRAHNFRFPRSVIITVTRSREKGSFVSCCLLRNATILLDHFIHPISASLVVCCSGSPARCFSLRLACLRFSSRIHAAQHRCLHSRYHKELLFADECQSVESFVQSKPQSLYGVYSTLTSSPHTEPFSRM
jgi:hypothetical protein